MSPAAAQRPLDGRRESGWQHDAARQFAGVQPVRSSDLGAVCKVKGDEVPLPVDVSPAPVDWSSEHKFDEARHLIRVVDGGDLRPTSAALFTPM